jgi:hypothetical protein
VLAVNYFYKEKYERVAAVKNAQIDRPLDETRAIPSGRVMERVELFHLEILMTEFDSPAGQQQLPTATTAFVHASDKEVSPR